MPATLTAPTRVFRPNEDDYARNERLVHAVCHWFQRRHPGVDYAEAHSVAAEAYAKARADYNPYKGAKFSTHVYNRVRFALLGWWSGVNRDATRCRPFSNLEDRGSDMVLDSEGLPVGAGAGPDKVPERSRFDPRAFLAELGDDARAVVGLIWESFGGDPNKVTRRESRNLLKRVFAELGWAGGRFMQAIRELREAVS